jgi:hypothetical protein
MNEALVVGAAHQHELVANPAEKLNEQLFH